MSNQPASFEDQRPNTINQRQQSQEPTMPASGGTQTQRGHTRWFWLSISVAILVFIYGGLTTAGILLTHTVTETRDFSVGTKPTLVIASDNGNVHIMSGPSGQIHVVAHERVFLGDSGSLPIQYAINSDNSMLKVIVNSGVQFNFINFGSGIDFDIMVPTQTNINARTGNGSIAATAVDGQIKMIASNGSITANQLSGSLIMDTANGSIIANSISVAGTSEFKSINGSIIANQISASGDTTMETSNGSIFAHQMNAGGNTSFKTNNGSIVYSGSLDPNGSYLYITGNGSIALSLPSDASFQVHASTGLGSVGSDFSYINGDAANGTVGSAPYAQLVLHTGNGSIYLHKGA